MNVSINVKLSTVNRFLFCFLFVFFEDYKSDKMKSIEKKM